MAERNTRRRFLRFAAGSLAFLGGCGRVADESTKNTVAPQLRGTPSVNLTRGAAGDARTAAPDALQSLSETWSSPTAPGLVVQVRVVDGAVFAVLRRADARTEISRRQAADGTIRWTRTLSGSVTSRQPLVYGGDTVLVRTKEGNSGARPGSVTALDTASGGIRWRLRNRGDSTVIETSQELAYVSGISDAGTRRVEAIDLTDGRRRWTVRSPNLRTVVTGDGPAFVVDGRTLRAVDRTGERLWHTSTNAVVPPTAATGQGIVLFAGPVGNTLAGYDAVTGSVRWRYPVWSDGLDGVTVSGTRVFVGGTNLARLSITGDEVWRITDRSVLARSYLDQAPLYLDRRTVLVALAPGSGRTLWQFEPPSGETVRPLAAVDPGIFIDAPATPPSEYWLLDHATGHPRGRYRSNGPIYASATTGRRLFVGKRGEVAAVAVPSEASTSPIDSA